MSQFEIQCMSYWYNIVFIAQFQIETGDNPGVLFKTHPNINKELFSNENILGLKDPNRPFPTGQTGDASGVGLLKWRMQSMDESVVPLTSEFWVRLSTTLSNFFFFYFLKTFEYWFITSLNFLFIYLCICSQLLAICFRKWNLCQHRIWSFSSFWPAKCCYYCTTSCPSRATKCSSDWWGMEVTSSLHSFLL